MINKPNGHCYWCGEAVEPGRLYCNESHGAMYREKGAGKGEQKAVEIRYRRPDSGPRCSTCGKTLYDYEIKWGKCLPHKHGGIITHRNDVKAVRATLAAAIAQGAKA